MESTIDHDKKTMKNIMLVGIQGSGKWTQARNILEKYPDNFVLFEMGGELRRFILTDSDEAREAKLLMDAGKKAPTSAIIAMTEAFLKKNKTKRILLDWVIRSRDQHEAIGHLFGNFDVLYLDLDIEIAVQRLCGRRIDPVTQETFPASFTGDTNPKTGNTLITRADDTEDAIRSRISWSISDTLPLLDIWKKSGHHVYDINASQTEADIFREVEKIVWTTASLGITYDIEKITQAVSEVKISPDVDKALFFAEKMRMDMVYHTAALEGNPYTFPEVQTLLDGITVWGHKLSDTDQLLHLDRAWTHLIASVRDGSFIVNQEYFSTLQKLIAENEALKSGIFRDGGVYIAGTSHQPPEAKDLESIFTSGLDIIEAESHPILRAFLFFLWWARNQFYYDGNKRTSRMMANGILLSAWLPPLNILAWDQLAYNREMICLYDTGDATETLSWLIGYYADRVREMGF
jgi:adenylate kinase family enzyme